MAIKKIMAMVFVVAALCMLNTRAAYVEDAYPAYFSYSGSTGPQFWGSLSPSYAKCSNGTAQSPINIVNRDTVLNRSLNALNIQFRDSVNATLINYGFKVEVKSIPFFYFAFLIDLFFYVIVFVRIEQASISVPKVIISSEELILFS